MLEQISPTAVHHQALDHSGPGHGSDRRTRTSPLSAGQHMHSICVSASVHACHSHITVPSPPSASLQSWKGWETVLQAQLYFQE